jgi:hypothetical protein
LWNYSIHRRIISVWLKKQKNSGNIYSLGKNGQSLGQRVSSDDDTAAYPKIT